MSKRFTSTLKWRDTWFRKLSSKLKCLWFYILDECDNSGVWKSDFEMASFCIGEQLTEMEALEAFNAGKIRVQQLTEGYWHVKDFVSFQYGKLSEKSIPHKSVLTLINHHESTKGYCMVGKGLVKGRARDKDKDKDKDKGFSNDLSNIDTEILFKEVWDKYPNKDGRKEALRHFKATILNVDDHARCKQALENYLASDRVKKGFVKNGSTWFNCWEDWVDYKEIGGQNGASGSGSTATGGRVVGEAGYKPGKYNHLRTPATVPAMP